MGSLLQQPVAVTRLQLEMLTSPLHVLIQLLLILLSAKLLLMTTLVLQGNGLLLLPLLPLRVLLLLLMPLLLQLVLALLQPQLLLLLLLLLRNSHGLDPSLQRPDPLPLKPLSDLKHALVARRRRTERAVQVRALDLAARVKETVGARQQTQLRLGFLLKLFDSAGQLHLDPFAFKREDHVHNLGRHHSHCGGTKFHEGEDFANQCPCRA
mmetsp:Transcript_104641/g.272365  ORF Transcript_104641/g.272365 Transcript_104641/m.272365 type:complete len:210 (-) Transcript_104641:1-630(-)